MAKAKSAPNILGRRRNDLCKALRRSAIQKRIYSFTIMFGESKTNDRKSKWVWDQREHPQTIKTTTTKKRQASYKRTDARVQNNNN